MTPIANDAGNLVFLDARDARGHELVMHVHSTAPAILFLSAWTGRQSFRSRRAAALDRESARAVRDAIDRWLGEGEGRP